MFDQAKLKEEIEKTWGPSGAHMAVFEEMEKRLKESQVYLLGQPQTAHQVAELLIVYMKAAIADGKQMKSANEVIMRIADGDNLAGIDPDELRKLGAEGLLGLVLHARLTSREYVGTFIKVKP